MLDVWPLLPHNGNESHTAWFEVVAVAVDPVMGSLMGGRSYEKKGNWVPLQPTMKESSVARMVVIPLQVKLL
mgnify:CR=1 FL=1